MDRVAQGRAAVTGDEAHHLTRVLRVEAGQVYEICDNERVFLAEVETARKSLVEFVVREELSVPPPGVQVTLYAALIKFDHWEYMLEKATELGVARIVPVIAERTDKGLDKAAEKRMARWRRIVVEASQQSRRARLPELEDVVPLRNALTRSDAGLRYWLEEESAPPVLSALPPQRRAEDQVALFIGPEGGWVDHERAAAREAGWQAVSLGKQILRAETAAIAGLAVVQAAWLG